MRRGGWITSLGCMAPFIAGGLWLGCQIDLPGGVGQAIDRLAGTERLFPVLVGGKVGYIDRTGKLVLPARYEPTGPIGIDAISMATPPEGMGYWQNRRVTWGCDFSEGRAAVRTGAGLQMIDATGRAILEEPIDRLGEFNAGLAWFKKDKRYGLMGRDGRIRGPAIYDREPEYLGPSWKVQLDGNAELLDGAGASLTGGVYTAMRDPSDGLMAASRDGKWGYVNLVGREVIPCTLRYARDFSDGYAMVDNAGGRAVIDKRGTVCPWVWPPSVARDDGLYLQESGELVGLVDRQGKWVVPPRYKQIGRYGGGTPYGPRPSAALAAFRASAAQISSTAPAGIGQWWDKTVEGLNQLRAPARPLLSVVQTADGKWGIMDMDGRLCSSGLDGTIFDSSRPRFCEGRARVLRNGKVGFVDETGKIVIEPQFDYAEDFSGGLSRFTMGLTPRQIEEWINPVDFSAARWGYVDRAGRIVWEATR